MLTGYFGLFIGCFLAATILPLSSEFALIFMLENHYDPTICLLVASIANIIGGVTNYGIGSLGNPLWFKRFGVNEQKILSFKTRIAKNGYWVALFSWVPFLGDPLTVALGFFKVPFLKVLLLMSLGKVLRYMVLTLPYIL